MSTALDPDLYYDPFDVEIDKDPYPVWRRLRDEAPLYYNDRHDFFALSRFADVEQAMVDWDTYRSGRGSTLDIIKANIEQKLTKTGNVKIKATATLAAKGGLGDHLFKPVEVEVKAEVELKLKHVALKASAAVGPDGKPEPSFGIVLWEWH